MGVRGRLVGTKVWKVVVLNHGRLWLGKGMSIEDRNGYEEVVFFVSICISNNRTLYCLHVSNISIFNTQKLRRDFVLLSSPHPKILKYNI